MFNTVVRRAARSGVIRKLVTPASESTAVSPWGPVGLGITATAAGFFGKMLLDDKLEARRNDDLERRREVRYAIREAGSQSQTDKMELQKDIKSLEKKMDEEFKAINENIAGLRSLQMTHAIS